MIIINTLVSIVVPIYNVEDYIGKCIDSLRNQTYKDLEILLVNDGSPDNSVNICNDYAKRDSRIKIINKENGGLSDARNVGIDNATGKFILFVDGDDYIDKDTVKKAVGTMVDKDSDIVIWGYLAEYVDQYEAIQKVEVNKPRNIIYTMENISQMSLSIEKIDLIGYAWNKMYKLDILKNNKLYFTKGLSLVEDMLFNSKTLKYCEKITFISDSFTHYMQRPRETLGVKFYENYFDLKEKAMKSLATLFEYWEIEKDYRKKFLLTMRFNVVKATIKKICTNTQYSYSEKKLILSKFIKQENVKKIINNIETNSVKDKIVSFLIELEMKRILLFAYSKIK